MILLVTSYTDLLIQMYTNFTMIFMENEKLLGVLCNKSWVLHTNFCIMLNMAREEEMIESIKQ